jgi:hypothetical protein
MPIFQTWRTGADTCGNSWVIDGTTEYIEADSIRKVWEHFGMFLLSEYELPKGGMVFRSRTPKGKGYGIWETNPDFDQDFGLNHAIAVWGSGRAIQLVKTRKV